MEKGTMYDCRALCGARAIGSNLRHRKCSRVQTIVGVENVVLTAKAHALCRHFHACVNASEEAGRRNLTAIRGFSYRDRSNVCEVLRSAGKDLGKANSSVSTPLCHSRDIAVIQMHSYQAYVLAEHAPVIDAGRISDTYRLDQ